MGEPKKRAATSGTRKSSASGSWGQASGIGWGGESRGSGKAQLRRLSPEERARLQREAIELYLAFARDPEQSALIRMQAARHLLDRIDNPFLDLLF